MRFKRQKVFDFKSLVLLLCIVLVGGIIVVNLSGVKFQTETGEQNEYTYINYENKNNGKLQRLKICLALDGSGSGWQAVVNENLIEHLSDALVKFADEGHTVEFDSFSRDHGARSTSLFLDIDSNPDADIWNAIKFFKNSYIEPYGDIAYDKYVENGIERLNKKDSEGYKKILVVVIRSQNAVWKVTDEDVARIKNLLQENDVKLYVIGLRYGQNRYDLFKKYAGDDKVYEEIDVKDSGDVLTDILMRESYSNLLNAAPDSTFDVALESDKNKCIVSGGVTIYSNTPYNYTLTRVLRDKENNEYEKLISSGAMEYGKNILDFSDIKIERENLTYRLKFSGCREDTKLFYEKTFTQADVVQSDLKLKEKLSIFEILSNKIGFKVDIIVYVIEALIFILFIARLIKRFVICIDADKEAMSSESKR